MCVDLLYFYIQNSTPATTHTTVNYGNDEVTKPSWNHYFIPCETFVTLSIMEEAE